MAWYSFHIDKEMVDKRSSNKILITHQEKQKMQVLCKFFVTKNIIFEVYVILTNMYCLLHITKSHKMTKLDNIIFDLGPEDVKS